MQKLIIYLPNEEGAPPLCAYADNSPVPQDLTVAAKNKDVIVIVPAEDVLLTQATLPKLSKSRLTQALPFALEEQLISELDTLHFASVSRKNDEYAVAVIAREKIKRWLQRLNEWKIKPDLLLPSCLAMTYDENRWHVIMHDHSCIARTGAYQGFACERENLAELLQLAIATNDSLPEEIIIHNYTSQPVATELRLAIPTREELLPAQNFITDLAMNQENFADLNLLQGGYTLKKGKGTPLKKLIYLSVALMSAWTVLLFTYPTVSYFILKKRLDVLNTEVAKIYKHNFPTATNNMIAPKMRLEEKLHKLSSVTSDSRFLSLLSYLSYALAETPNINLKRFEYQNNQLNLEIIAGTSEDVTAFSNCLTNKGLNVKQQNATLNGSRVNATIVVE